MCYRFGEEDDDDSLRGRNGISDLSSLGGHCSVVVLGPKLRVVMLKSQFNSIIPVLIELLWGNKLVVFRVKFW